MRIAISGKSGCGNTTVSALVAKKLGYKQINYTFRQLAQKKNMDFWELCEKSKTDDSYDKEVDNTQVQLAMAEENCVLASRLAIWVLKEADLKVYLKASPEVRASRVFKREGGTLEDRMAETVKRDTSDTERYKRIYGIDNDKFADVADFVLDVDKLNPEECAQKILEQIKKKKK